MKKIEKSPDPRPIQIDTVNLATGDVETTFTNLNSSRCRVWLTMHLSWALRCNRRVEITPVDHIPEDQMHEKVSK